MGRLLALDIGRKRTGVAVTDILQICANGLPTVRTCDLINFLKDYCQKEDVEAFIVGEPRDLMGNPSESMKYITPVLNKIKKDFPEMPIKMQDERFTSTIAHQAMIEGGMKKRAREEKGRADEIAAVLILTGYLDGRK